MQFDPRYCNTHHVFMFFRFFIEQVAGSVSTNGQVPPSPQLNAHRFSGVKSAYLV